MHIKASAARLGIFIGMALALTWPLAWHLGTHLPLGTESVATVPLFNLWTLTWNAGQLAAGYPGYWDAPIFYPETGTFALSDPQPLSGLLFALPYLLTQNGVLAYNLTLLALLTLNGWAAYRLLRTLQIRDGAALLGSALVQALPFVQHEIGVIQLVPLFPILFALAALFRFGRDARPRDGLILGGWLAAALLFSGYYGLFLGVMIALGGLIFARRAHLTLRGASGVLWGALTLGLILAPVLPAQRRLLTGYAWSDRTVAANSAYADDYLRLEPGGFGGLTPWVNDEGGTGQALFPGTGVLLLGAAGAVVAWRRGQRRWAAFALAGAGAAFLFSLGTHLDIVGFQPYAFIRTYMPGYTQLRSPFRMAVFVQVFTALLAAYGLEILWSWRGRLGRGVAVGLTLLSIAEVTTLPHRLYTTPELISTPAWALWLKEQPPAAAIMIPFEASGNVSDFEPTTLGMVLALEHGKPLLNGYSGFFPDSYRQLKAVIAFFPSPASVAILTERAPLYLIIERGWLTLARLEGISEVAGVELVYEDKAKFIYWLDTE